MAKNVKTNKYITDQLTIAKAKRSGNKRLASAERRRNLARAREMFQTKGGV